MKKFTKIIYYVAIIVVSLGIIYSDSILQYFRSADNAEQGVLVTVFNSVARYFTNAEAWNYIFLILFLAAALVLFVLLDMSINFLLRRFIKKPSLSKVVLHPGFTLTAQKFISGAILIVCFIIACNALIIYYGNSHSVEVSSSVDKKQPALILGTSKMLRSGKGINLYYKYRIDAAKDLWDNGKVDYFIVSGDRSGDHYDETRDIKNDLMAFGVPEEKIKLDTAGFRTLDSMLRIRGLYKASDVVIISQQFHVQRALFLASFYGMNGVGYYAKGTSTTAMVIRETFGKCKVVLDLILFNMMPRVALADSAMTYREEFKVKSDKHVILLLVVAIAAFSTIGLVVKFLD